jgi:hypothetical protein
MPPTFSNSLDPLQADD